MPKSCFKSQQLKIYARAWQRLTYQDAVLRHDLVSLHLQAKDFKAVINDRSSIQSRRTTSGEFYHFASLIPAEFPSRLTWQDFTDLRRQEYGIFFVANVDDGQVNLLNSVITFRMLVATADEFQAR